MSAPVLTLTPGIPLTASWTSITGASSYVVSYGTSSGVFDTVLSPVTSTSTNLSGLTAGVIHYVRVAAQNSAGSRVSQTESVTPIAPLTLDAPSIMTANQLRLTWSTPTGATSVALAYGTSAGSYPTSSACASSPCDITLTAGTTYYFQATASNTNQGLALSQEVSGAPLGSVVLQNREQTALGTVGLSWDAVAGATSYRIIHGASAGDLSSQNAVVTGTSDSISGLSANVDRFIQLVAINSTGSLASPTRVFKPIGALSFTSITLNAANSLIYTWATASGASQYTLRRGTSTGSYPTLTSCSASPCTEGSLSANVTYFAQVRATNADGGLMLSSELSGTPLSPPTLTITGSGGASLTANWSSASGVTYGLRYGTSSGSYPTLVSATSTSPQSVTGLSYGNVYYFQLTLSNTNGSLTATEASFSNIVSFSPSTARVGSILTLTCPDCSGLTQMTAGGTAGLILSKSQANARVFLMPGSTSGNVVATIGSASATMSGLTIQSSSAPTSQQGSKLVGSGATGAARQGTYAALSADGNTAMLGGSSDNTSVGAAWVFTRSGSTWTQQGSKLVGSGNTGSSQQGIATSLSADGNTAIIGGFTDNTNVGASWVFTRSGTTWTQQGSKLSGTGNIGNPSWGISVAVSADGNTAAMGGDGDNGAAGAVWIFTP